MNTTARDFGAALLLVLRLATAGLFVWAAVVKLADPRDFLFSINGFKIVPEHMLDPLAFMVPWTEMVCAAALIVGFWGRAAALVIGAMLVVFVGAILSVLARGMSVECGCFGDFSLLCRGGTIGWCNVGQNALLFAIALPVMVWGPGALSWDARAQRRCRRAEDEQAA
jgi:uncharacterized membrane protein YphA (DoxX/SURF4 family)